MENLWILIPLVAIIGGFFLKYQEHKAKIADTEKYSEQEVEDLYKLVDALKTRIENLEAIAAEAPDDFNAEGGREKKINETGFKEENRQEISKLANNLKAKS